MLELLDKDINTFAMRVKEWYSWHYPELARVISDNQVYVKLVHLIGDRATTAVTIEEIEEICGEAELAERVI